MKLSRVFSPDDFRRVEEAVRQAEQRTSGEIVPFVVERSDAYSGATWRASTLGALLASLAAAALFNAIEMWGVPLALWIAAPAVLGAGIGHLAVTLLPGLRRALVAGRVMAERVEERAAHAFLSEEVFATRERTGVLIFLSLFERRAVVMGDKGIAAKVRQEDWDGVIEGLVGGMREGRPGEALVGAIERCSRLLESHGVERRADDRDELADGLRTGNR